MPDISTIRRIIAKHVSTAGSRLLGCEDAAREIAAAYEAEATPAQAALEKAAQLHECEAQRLNRLRDPGMANHHRAWAKRIRDLSHQDEQG